MTLMDSLQKRIRFLETLSDKLNLQARCVHGRAEELAHRAEFREQADVVCARAVAYLPTLSEYCLGFVRVGGIFLVMKGEQTGAEIADAQRAVKTMGGEISAVLPYTLPGMPERTVIVIQKISHTLRNYPRNKGVMTKKPL